MKAVTYVFQLHKPKRSQVFPLQTETLLTDKSPHNRRQLNGAAHFPLLDRE